MATNPMNIIPPVPETTPGPAWATQVNTILTDVIAPHDHTSNKGVQITPAGMNINADLNVQNNNIVDARTLRFANQTTAIQSVTDVGCLYESSGDLVYIDGNGQAIPITANGQINVASVGGINGLPAGTAQVGFATDTYTFKKSSTGYALMDHGQIKIRSSDQTNPPYGVTVKVPIGVAADYDFILPAAKPTQESFLVQSTNGALSNTLPTAGGINTANLADNAVTRAKQAAVGQITGSATNITLNASSYVNLMGGTITTTGRPVMVSLQGDTVGSDGYLLTKPNFSITVNSLDWKVNLRIKVVSGATTTYYDVGSFGGIGVASGTHTFISYFPFVQLLPLAAGTYTITIQATTVNTPASLVLGYYSIYEL